MKKENYIPPFPSTTQKITSHTSLSQNRTHCGGEDESCTLASVPKRTKMGQCAAGIFLAWTILDVKSTKTLKAQPLCRPCARWCLVKALPMEMMTISKPGIYSSWHPPASLLTEEQLHVLQKESKSEGWQFSPSDFYFYTYTQHLKGDKNSPVL